MPWEVKKKGDKYCVFKKGASSPIKGGCHDTKEEARNHQKALYKNVEGSRITFEHRITASALELDPAPQLVTVPNVPICSTGIEYPLSSGPRTFTEEDLQHIVIAANEDPHIVYPRLKLGWLDGHGASITEPAFGTAQNLRLGDNNQTVYADFVGVPKWLAEILPTVYPSRSIEAGVGVKTAGGNKYNVVVTHVALLGVELPGITCLADLKNTIYSTAVPTGTKIAAKGGVVSDINASVNMDDVRRLYYESLDASGPQYAMWWVRGVELAGSKDEDDQLIVDDGMNKLYRVPFKIKGEKVTFSDPIEVKIKYVDTPTKEVAAAYMSGLIAATGDRIAASFASREESGRIQANTQEGGGDLDVKEVAKSLGLPENATEEQVTTEIARLRQVAPPAQQVDPATGQQGTGQPPMAFPPAQEGSVGPRTDNPAAADHGPSNPAGPAAVPPPTPDPPQGASGDPEPVGTNDPTRSIQATVLQDGTVKLDKGTYDMLMAGAQAGLRAEQQRIQTEDAAFIDTAIRAGKIPSASREQYLKLMAMDRNGTATHVNGLAPGLIPVGEAMGHTGGNADLQAGAAASEGLPVDWFPGLARRRELAAAGPSRVVMAQEG